VRLAWSRVTKTARAEQDLEEIWFYVALDDVAAADALLDEVENCCRLLATQPKMGRAREELASELRSFPVRRYVVFYRSLVDGIEASDDKRRSKYSVAGFALPHVPG
jgi:toxin ParE1/3/4